MSDIVERLRVGEACKENGGVCAVMDARSGCLCAIAADTITALRAENEKLRAALERIGYTKAGDVGATLSECVNIARAALDGQSAPSGWRPDDLITAANAIIDFYNGPAQAKRPDIFQRLMQRLANAVPPAPGKGE